MQLVDRSAAFRIAAELLAPDVATPKLQKYWYDPIQFIRDFFIGFKMSPYQKECIEHLVLNKKVCVRGPHGLGKTGMVAATVSWFAHTREDMCRVQGGDWKIVTTASVERQLVKYLWPEIKKWSRKGNFAWDQLGRDPFDRRTELLFTQLKLEYGEAFAVSASDPANIEGAHADHILYIVDEAKTVVPETFDAMEGALSGEGEALAFVISTPGEPVGRFYEIQSRKPGFEDWWSRHVTLAEAVKANRISIEWANARKRQWGEDSAIYQNRVLGNFAVDSQDSLIPLAWIEAAMMRGLEVPHVGGVDRKEVLEPGSAASEDSSGSVPNISNLPGVNRPQTSQVLLNQNRASCVACDVARSGTDKSTIAVRIGYLCMPLIVFRLYDTMEVTGELIQAITTYGFKHATYAVIDIVGIGAGVFDRMREQGFDVEAFNGASASMFTDASGELEFLNRRAAAWWGMRELLDPANEISQQVILPYDEELLGDLCTPRYKRTSSGKVAVEEKDQIRKRLGRSPDRGDAVVMAYADRSPVFGENMLVYDDPIVISPF